MVGAVRTMYKRVGLDPTKTRPSSEALLRRVRRGDSLPRINSMVDVCNWCSLEFQLPYGLYDASRIEGDVELRIGRDGVRIGVTAAPSVPVHRQEVYEQIRRANRAAASPGIDDVVRRLRGHRPKGSSDPS